MTTLYEKDFCEWLLIQASHFRNKEMEQLDIENLIEEIESLGRSNKSSLCSHLSRLMIHLLKMQYAFEQKGNSKSWDSSIFHSRREIRLLLRNSPSLNNYLPSILDECYQDAREGACIETSLKLEIFPEKCPWTIEEILKK